jgi:hypothetical protein
MAMTPLNNEFVTKKLNSLISSLAGDALKMPKIKHYVDSIKKIKANILNHDDTKMLGSWPYLTEAKSNIRMMLLLHKKDIPDAHKYEQVIKEIDELVDLDLAYSTKKNADNVSESFEKVRKNSENMTRFKDYIKSDTAEKLGIENSLSPNKLNKVMLSGEVKSIVDDEGIRHINRNDLMKWIKENGKYVGPDKKFLREDFKRRLTKTVYGTPDELLKSDWLTIPIDEKNIRDAILKGELKSIIDENGDRLIHRISFMNWIRNREK